MNFDYSYTKVTIIKHDGLKYSHLDGQKKNAGRETAKAILMFSEKLVSFLPSLIVKEGFL